MSNQDYYQNQNNNYYPPQGGYEAPSGPPPGHSPAIQDSYNPHSDQRQQYQPYQAYGQGGQYPDQPQHHQSYQSYGQYTQNNQQAYPPSPQQPVYASQSHGAGQSEPPPPYGYPPQQHAASDYNNPEGERGVLGALAGGAAGGFGGYKVGGKVGGHSKTTAVLGALAGAYAGHKLQDTVSGKSDDEKKKKEDKKDKKKKERSRSRSRSREFRGNFSGSSEDIYLEHDSHTLVARCWPVDGDLRSSSIDLNRYLENSWGNFRWVDGANGTGNFIASARKVRLRDNGKRLEAELGCGNGEWAISSINLDERIGNENGSLRFV
ncbi:unnamed protein product [Clonostachys rosea]|uniref:Cyanovirin-N domain-containing protein n=1 Tax=Bionectria ochroleuca TaxID=29856 RepID=A0ABY6V0M3_BIOOC|nr:unnamed protein product [Clonostachys rosea]